MIVFLRAPPNRVGQHDLEAAVLRVLLERELDASESSGA